MTLEHRELSMRRILVTGALGQIGAELVPALREKYGADAVVASDIRMPPEPPSADEPFEYVDCTVRRMIDEVVHKYDVGTIYHMASLLSAVRLSSSKAASIHLPRRHSIRPWPQTTMFWGLPPSPSPIIVIR